MADAFQIKFKLKKAAARGGGDRYTAKNWENFDIYIPQDISRQTGVPAKEIIVVIEPTEGDT